MPCSLLLTLLLPLLAQLMLLPFVKHAFEKLLNMLPQPPLKRGVPLNGDFSHSFATAVQQLQSAGYVCNKVGAVKKFKIYLQFSILILNTF